MANTLAEYDSAGCLTPFANGAEGQVLEIVNGTPTWVTVSITCEDIQDCIGTGVGPAIANTGISYNDATNSFKFDTGQLPAATGTLTNVVVSTSNQASGATMTPAALVTAMCTNILACAGIPITSGSGTLTAITNTPVVYTDTDTGNIYYRDPAGVIVQLGGTFDIPISNITGVPPGTAGSPGVFVDTDTGTVYYRDQAGSVVVIEQTCCVSLSSGSGAPSNAVLNDATIHTDTDTGIVYYRDKDGNVGPIYYPVPITSGVGTPAATSNSPTIYTDTATGNIYYRDNTGVNVQLGGTFDIPISNITGIPPGTAGSPGVFVDTDTGTTYYRDQAGSVTVIEQTCCVSVSSGAGAPSNAVLLDATVYTDTTTGNVWYRDKDGNTVIIDHLPLPVAAYEETDITGLVHTYDAASSTSTENGVTIASYAWTVAAVGASGAATLGTPAAATTTVTYPTSTGSWLLTLTVTDSNGKTKSVTKLVTLSASSGSAIPITNGAGAPAATASSPTIYTNTTNGDIYYRDDTGANVIIDSNPLPVAAYEETAIAGLVHTYDAASSTSTENGVTIATYAWTVAAVGASGVATLGTPAASTTTVTYPSSTGSWLLTLTVTDANGNADSVTKLITLSNTSIPIASGAGAPAATANSPEVYTNTANGDIYYRDSTGATVIIDRRPLPVAAYEETAIAGLVHTYDAASSTSTENGVAISTYAWTVAAVGASGVATLGTPAASTTTVTYPSSTGSWLLTLTVTDANGNTDSVAKLITLSDTSIPITSGVGAPAATVGSPTVYTDTSTGNIYYRDSTGATTIIDRRPLPVAAYEITTKNATNRIWTFDSASATSTENGVTLATYAWTATPVGLSGAATVGTPAAATTTITFPATGSWLVGLTVTDSNGNTDTVTKLIEVADPVLVAAYEITSKLALTAAFDGSSSVNAVSYAWTAVAINGTVGAPTFATPAAATTTVTFPNDGEWQITLTVTDSSGNTKAVTKNIAVARYITVAGNMTEINGQRFATLQAAFNWINANDAANAALYTILVQSVTTDAARIVPNLAKVRFDVRGQIPVGVDFPTGTYNWTGTENRNGGFSGINCAAGSAVTCAAGTFLQFEGVTIVSADATAYAVDSLGANSYIAILTNCFVNSTGGGIRSLTAGSVFNIIHSYINANGRVLPSIEMSGATIVAEHSLFQHSQGFAVRLTATSGRFVNCDITSNRSTTAGDITGGFDINTTGLGSTLNITGCAITVNNAGVAPGFTAGIRVQGSAGSLYISNSSIICGQYGIVLVNTVANNTPNLLMHGLLIFGVTTPLIGSNSTANVTAVAITGIRMYQSTMQGTPNALLTYAAGVASGNNISGA